MNQMQNIVDKTTRCREDAIPAGSSAPRCSRFPMSGGPTIDWEAAQEIYRLYSCLYGQGQSLETIASRGGFGWAEVQFIHEKHTRQKARGACRCANPSFQGGGTL